MTFTQSVPEQNDNFKLDFNSSRRCIHDSLFYPLAYSDAIWITVNAKEMNDYGEKDWWREEWRGKKTTRTKHAKDNFASNECI